mmetsp:Transcript_18898/g.38499  ORF Transcript_18898/g.38499 Transcript_18898/m.38499 type:complete len:122 (+) Transcript_18898:1397-1762(+)
MQRKTETKSNGCLPLRVCTGFAEYRLGGSWTLFDTISRCAAACCHTVPWYICDSAIVAALILDGILYLLRSSREMSFRPGKAPRDKVSVELFSFLRLHTSRVRPDNELVWVHWKLRQIRNT